LENAGSIETQIKNSPFRSKFEGFFGIDVRSLALFRISLAVLIISDLVNRYRDLEAHYTDFGVLPRGPLIEKFMQPSQWSLHLMSGTFTVQAGLFILAGIFAVMLFLGYRTRFATIASWIMLISLHTRNPMVLQGGDVLLRLLLFWSMFLPLGLRYSFDAALNSSSDRPPRTILSMGSAALLLQVCFVYWFSAALKWHPIWTEDYTAVYYALSIDQFATPLGHWLLNFPNLLKTLTFLTLYLEALGPFLAFFPYLTGPLRSLTVFVFFGFHAGMVLTMELGLFPYISAAAWIVFLPDWFWDKFQAHFTKGLRVRGFTIYYDGDCSFCKKIVYCLRTFLMLPDAIPVLPAQEHPEIFEAMQTQNSMIVQDGEKNLYFKYDAFLFLLECSPVFRFCLPVLRWKGMAEMGGKIQAVVAENRGKLGKLFTFLSFRPLNVSTPKILNVVAIVFLTYIFLWNVRTTYNIKYQNMFPEGVNWFAHMFRVDQSWKMFTPHPRIAYRKDCETKSPHLPPPLSLTSAARTSSPAVRIISGSAAPLIISPLLGASTKDSR